MKSIADHLEALDGQPFGNNGAKESKCPPGEQKTAQTTDARKHEALGQQLTDQPRPTGAKRGANRKLAVTRRRPRQEEVGDVGAGNQENERHSGGEHDECGTDVAGQLLAQRHDA